MSNLVVEHMMRDVESLAPEGSDMGHQIAAGIIVACAGFVECLGDMENVTSAEALSHAICLGIRKGLMGASASIDADVRPDAIRLFLDPEQHSELLTALSKSKTK